MPDPDAVARRAAETLVATASGAAAAGRRAAIALSGGSTPRRLFTLLAGEYRSRLDWSRLEIFFGDERCVPPDDERSNYHMARETLLDHLPIPSRRVHRMPAEEPDLPGAARRYGELLSARLPAAVGGAPVLDLVWLGLGEDGHTASLFPGTSAIEERERWVVANAVPSLGVSRMTLTFPVIESARRVQFLVTGKAKREVARAILEEGLASGRPAARLLPEAGRIEWVLDRAAAGM